MWKRVGVVVAGLALVGCSGAPEPAPEPTSSAPREVFTARPAPDYVPSPEPAKNIDQPAGEPTPRGHWVAPDPELVAAMTCEPVSDATRAAHAHHYPILEDAVQVLVGEGNEPGSQWWVVSSFDAEDKIFRGQGQVYLTDEPGVDGRGTWINLSIGKRRAPDGEYRPTFHNVDWDDDKVARGQSAVVKVGECLSDVG